MFSVLADRISAHKIEALEEKIVSLQVDVQPVLQPVLQGTLQNAGQSVIKSELNNEISALQVKYKDIEKRFILSEGNGLLI